MFNLKNIVLFVLFLSIVQSRENSDYKNDDEDNEPDLRSLDRPFRMAKLNIAWERAQKELNYPTLKAFFAELKVNDKELFEWKHKRDKNEANKEGLKQAKLMFNLVMVMEKYGLLNYMDDKTKTKRDPVTPSTTSTTSTKSSPTTTLNADERLTEPKLKSLYMELKMQDKEEIGWKQLNSQHKDKEGLKAAELRQKLIGIMSSYDLLEHFEETQDPQRTKPYRKFRGTDDHMNKSLFRDKKLNELWEKAEVSGFSPDELKTLKEEFIHHQDKVDMYYSLLENVGNIPGKIEMHENAVEEDMESLNLIPGENDNEIPTPAMETNIYHNNIHELRERHRSIKDHFERLERLVSSGPHSQDFIEPKVQGLWRVAMSSNFTEKELDSIKAELHHFESRLLKLRHLHAEHALQKHKYKSEKNKDKNDRFVEMEDHIKKQTRKVEKIQENIEGQIFRHTEL